MRYCDRCLRPDDRWMIIKRVRLIGGGLVTVWKHKPCKTEVGELAEVAVVS